MKEKGRTIEGGGGVQKQLTMHSLHAKSKRKRDVKYFYSLSPTLLYFSLTMHMYKHSFVTHSFSVTPYLIPIQLKTINSLPKM